MPDFKIVKMNENLNLEYKEDLLKYIKSINDELEYEELETYTNILDNFNYYLKQDILIYLDNNDIRGFAIVYSSNYYEEIIKGFKEFYIYYCQENIIIIKLAEYIKENYSDVVLIDDYIDDNISKVFSIQKFDSDIYGIRHWNFCMDRDSNYLDNILKIYIKETFFEKLNDFQLEKVTYKYLNSNELRDIIYDKNKIGYNIPIDQDENSFSGFHYFSPVDMNHEHSDDKYLLAFFDNIIIGIIDIGRYCFNREKDKEYLGVNYIDINKACKNKGLSKELVKQLNKHLSKEMFLIGSTLSKEGQLCKIDKVFNKYITNTRYFDTTDEYVDNYYFLNLVKDLKKEFGILNSSGNIEELKIDFFKNNAYKKHISAKNISDNIVLQIQFGHHIFKKYLVDIEFDKNIEYNPLSISNISKILIIIFLDMYYDKKISLEKYVFEYLKIELARLK